MIKKLRLLFFFVLVIGLLFLSVDLYNLNKNKRETVVVGAKNMTESHILGEILSILIEENSNLAVKRKFNLEGTFLAFHALQSGEIDICPEYTGTALVGILKEDKVMSSKQCYNYVKSEFSKKYNISWLPPFGFKNNYALIMTRKKSEESNIFSISDLKGYSSLIYGFDPEFISRTEFNSLCRSYSFLKKKNNKYKTMDHTLLYYSLIHQDIDVIDGFTTDSMILHHDLLVLKDVNSSLPEYDAAPIIREETLQNHPFLKDLISNLFDEISESDMQEMNYLSDYKKQDNYKIARDFLLRKSLIK